MREEAIADLRSFVDVIEQLRAPGGCPWDREQTHESLAPFLLEETYEALDAIDRNTGTLREELGDLLLQVAMHSAIAAETRDSGDGFDIGDVAATITAKMIHRHPHVFGDVSISDARDVVINWEKLKASEKQDRESLLDGIPNSLPALAHAQAVQRRPARIGYEPTPSVDDALEQVREGLKRVIENIPDSSTAPATGEDWVATDGGFARGDAVVAGDIATPATAAATESIGALLFAVVALARRLRVSAEDALRAESAHFAQHFRRLEEHAQRDGVDLHNLSDDEWLERWRNS